MSIATSAVHHRPKINPRRLGTLGSCVTYLRSDKGVVKASGSATNVQDWVDQGGKAYTFEQAVYENKWLANLGFEVNLGSWTQYNSNVTATTVQSSADSFFGTGSLLITITAAGAGAGIASRYQRSAAASFAAGDIVSCGVRIKIVAKTGAANVRLSLVFENNVNEGLASYLTTTTTTGSWVILTILNKTAPANTDHIIMALQIRTEGVADTATIYFDGIQVVKAASLPTIYSQGNSIKNSFDQRTTASQPVVTPGVFRGLPGITFDGTDDLLRSILGAYLVESSGLVMAVVKLTGVTTATQVILASSDEGTATSYLSLRARRSDATPNVNVIQRNAADVADDIHGDSTVSAGPLYVVVIRSDGSTYTERVNGREEALTEAAGANAGDWAADTTLKDNVTMGAKKDSTGTVSPLQGYLMCVLVYEGDPGMGARMKQLERMIRQRGIGCLR